MRCVVLGAGRVGSAIAVDLAQEPGWEVRVADFDSRALEGVAARAPVATQQADLTEPDAVTGLVHGARLVVGAVPGPMGFATLRRAIEAGIDIVDISFFEEDPFDLDELARDRGVVAVVDAGIAPGFDNLILGHAETVFDRVDRFSCYVGGLPTARHWPYEYRAVFSPIDVIAEYTRPARLVEQGRVVTRPALSERELLDFPGVGTLEAFNTDGLRTLLRTVSVPDMKEKTMRFPGHAELMLVLRETGFFGEDPVEVGDVAVRPIDLTARLLFPAWKLAESEEDITVMRVEVEGEVGGNRTGRRLDLLDRFDRASGTTSMARTTGYTCTGVVRALAAGLYSTPGVAPLEVLGRVPGVFDLVRDHLEQRGVVFDETELVGEDGDVIEGSPRR